MKSSPNITVVVATFLTAALLTPLTFAVPVSVFHYDSDHCDPLRVPQDVDELGIGGRVLTPPHRHAGHNGTWHGHPWRHRVI